MRFKGAERLCPAALNKAAAGFAPGRAPPAARGCPSLPGVEVRPGSVLVRPPRGSRPEGGPPRLLPHPPPFADREREEEEEKEGGGRLPGGPRLRGVAPGRAAAHRACAVENFSPCPTEAALGRRAGPRAGRAGSRSSEGKWVTGSAAARGGRADCSSQSAARREAAPRLGGNGGGGTGAAGLGEAARGVGRRGPGAAAPRAFLCLSLCEYVLEELEGSPGADPLLVSSLSRSGGSEPFGVPL